MNKTICAILTATVTAGAYAGGHHYTHIASPNLPVSATSSAKQMQIQGQQSTQILQVMESPYKVTQSESRGDFKVRNTPNVSVAAPAPSAPCYVGLGGGVAGAGFGVSLAGSTYDKECEERETIRLGLSSGDTAVRQMANEILLQKLRTIKDRSKPEQVEEVVFNPLDID